MSAICYVTAHLTRILNGDGTFLVVFVHYYQKRTHVEHEYRDTRVVVRVRMQARHRTDHSRLLYHWRVLYDTVVYSVALLKSNSKWEKKTEQTLERHKLRSEHGSPHYHLDEFR